MEREIEGNGWLCRHCNTLVANDMRVCPRCGADRPEESHEPLPEDISEVVHKDGYANAAPKVEGKYIFREAVLINAADILLVLGLFATFGALIAPYIVEFDVAAPMLWATCAAIVLFAITMITWALLRNVAEISRMLRNKQ